MKSKKLLIMIAAITAITVTGVASMTGAIFTDSEQSTDNTLQFSPVFQYSTINFRAASSGSVTSGTSLTVNKPAGTAQGDVLIAAVAARTLPMTITAPSGWTEIRTDTQTVNTTHRGSLFWKAAGASEPANYTFTFSASVSGAVGIIAAFSGVDTTNPVNVHNGQATSGSSTNIPAPSVTTTFANTMIVTAHSVVSSGTDGSAWTPPSGMTEAAEKSSGSGLAGLSETMNYVPQPVAGASGIKTAVVAGHNETEGIGQTVALKPNIAGSGVQSFYYITPVKVTPSVADSWQDVDVSSYIPAGATGVILHYDMTGASVDEEIGFRKNGSTDNRTGVNRVQTHAWAMIGVDSNRIFEAYVGSTAIDIWLVGYTTAGVVFFDNSIPKTVAVNNSWQDISVAVDTGADTAIGVILEVAQSSASITWGVRKNGSTDDRRSASAYQHKWAIIGVDSNEIFEGRTSAAANVTFHVIGYVKSGAYFFTNGVNKTPAVGAWRTVNVSGDTVGTDIANGVFIEIHGTTDGPMYGLRKNGSSEAIIAEARRHAWGIVECDASEIYQAYLSVSGPTQHLIGYSIRAP